MTSQSVETSTEIKGITRVSDGFIVRVTRKDPITNRTLDKREKVQSYDIQDAIKVKERISIELNNEVQEGKNSSRDIAQLSYCAFADFFQKYRRDNAVCRLNVINSDDYIFQKFIVPHIGNVKVANINRRLVMHFADCLRSEMNEHGVPYSLATYKRAWGLFRNTVRFCYKFGYISSDPTHLANVKFPLAKKPGEKISLSKEQAALLLAGAERIGTTEFAIVALALVLGLRSAEIKAIRFCDVDLQHGTINVCKSFHRGVMNSSVKNGRNFQAALVGVALQAVAKHWDRHCQRKNPGDIFLPAVRSGKIWDNHWINEVLERICKSNNIPVVTIHCLRVTSNTLLLNSGIAPEIVSRILNHKSGAAMRLHYTRISNEQAKEALLTAWTQK